MAACAVAGHELDHAFVIGRAARLALEDREPRPLRFTRPGARRFAVDLLAGGRVVRLEDVVDRAARVRGLARAHERLGRGGRCALEVRATTSFEVLAAPAGTRHRRILPHRRSAPFPCGPVKSADRRQDPQRLRPGVKPLAELEREAILRARDAVGGNCRRAAEILGIGERTLYDKLKGYGVVEP